ncbi:P-loop containing nucleoside triphosphate hydrolase protein [Coccomyxa subellipsoidea C-169]|uniref:GTPase Der n=1 Tax=Coccomyxa subellipsoidea (strain C-169) TaxID=574566 RepID=I0Z7M8_COCSC|nr:P-loop containing nucleoside triphosphate hydrolase protein [Coccomyxa subellipsoidea C-169]EIE26647.1 P-loop containing nucleoside triphosphate hydrolase protein [Coccomyxa subellipsoidea C-169]|eukprot:XP_005651191.1 P-loop containing nucleoside triphosphate hydrolase protein [Coccomyxa subellipsoidea C-169]
MWETLGLLRAPGHFCSQYIPSKNMPMVHLQTRVRRSIAQPARHLILCQAGRLQNVAADEAAVQLDADAVSEKERLMYERLAQEVAAFESMAIASSTIEEEEEAAPVSRDAKKSKRTREARGSIPTDNGIPLADLPKVAIVGRPNVGKSALFNRITGSNLAIVYDYPGVTRDRLYTRASWGATDFVVVDTGGLMSDASQLPSDQRIVAIKALSDAGLPQARICTQFTLSLHLHTRKAIERQAAAAVAEANSIVLVMDGQLGLTAADEEIVSWLRRSHPNKPVHLAINKCENPQKADLQVSEFWALGLEPIAVSAISGTGTGELMEQLMASLAPPKSSESVAAPDAPLAVAIIGRPNVGKSSLLNSLAGEERSIVSAISGTTRDAIDTDVKLADGRRFKLIDTAGIRKRVAVADSKDGAEPLSVNRALQAVRRAEVVALVLDASECADAEAGRFTVTQQDFRLAELVAAEGRACVIVVNKWDTVAGKDANTHVTFQKEIISQLRALSWATIVFTSATTGQRVARILEAAYAAGEEHKRRITTATINMAAVRPPTFVFFVNDPKLFTDEYKRYVERQLRDNVGFPGTPLRLFWRGKAPATSIGGRKVDTGAYT